MGAGIALDPIGLFLNHVVTLFDSGLSVASVQQSIGTLLEGS